MFPRDYQIRTRVTIHITDCDVHTSRHSDGTETMTIQPAHYMVSTLDTNTVPLKDKNISLDNSEEHITSIPEDFMNARSHILRASNEHLVMNTTHLIPAHQTKKNWDTSQFTSLTKSVDKILIEEPVDLSLNGDKVESLPTMVEQSTSDSLTTVPAIAADKEMPTVPSADQGSTQHIGPSPAGTSNQGSSPHSPYETELQSETQNQPTSMSQLGQSTPDLNLHLPEDMSDEEPSQRSTPQSQSDESMPSLSTVSNVSTISPHPSKFGSPTLFSQEMAATCVNYCLSNDSPKMDTNNAQSFIHTFASLLEHEIAKLPLPQLPPQLSVQPAASVSTEATASVEQPTASTSAMNEDQSVSEDDSSSTLDTPTYNRYEDDDDVWSPGKSLSCTDDSDSDFASQLYKRPKRSATSSKFQKGVRKQPKRKPKEKKKKRKKSK